MLSRSALATPPKQVHARLVSATWKSPVSTLCPTRFPRAAICLEIAAILASQLSQSCRVACSGGMDISLPMEQLPHLGLAQILPQVQPEVLSSLESLHQPHFVWCALATVCVPMSQPPYCVPGTSHGSDLHEATCL